MKDYLLGASILCLALSSIHVGILGNPMRYLKNLPRITDNIGIIGKLLAALLSFVSIFISGFFILLAPFIMYSLGLYLFAKKSSMKGRIMAWSPYEMREWDQRAIDSSKLSVAAATATLAANVAMIMISFYIYKAG